MSMEDKFAEARSDIQEGKLVELSVRELLGWVGARMRGDKVNADIDAKLKEHGIRAEPDFRYVGSSAWIRLVEASQEATVADVEVVAPWDQDPTMRIGRLPAATKTVVFVKPDAPIQDVMDKLAWHGLSRIPVMQTERDVKGIVSWETIGRRLASHPQGIGATARDCMVDVDVVPESRPLFMVMGKIVTDGHVLVQGADRTISGIVTTTDLSEQFMEVAEPFLILGEIENHLRVILGRRLSADDLATAAADPRRTVESVADLDFGGYVRIFQNPELWEKLQLKVGREIFVAQLDSVREIRNDVMHFDPNGLQPQDLIVLRNTVRMLREITQPTR